ncbi:MAG: hypothetical protein HS116_07760 [Planctomycetes bacterium]|nr:hypothetical protein [Planctomycetota bacterium]
MGESFGEACREEARALYEIRIGWAQRFAAERGRSFSRERILETARQCLPATASYDPEGYEEFCGIARGAGVSPEQAYVLMGLTDLRDVLAWGPLPDGMGCSSFAVAPARGENGKLLLGQTWDLQTDNMPFVRLVRRRPDRGPATLAVTLTGCLTLIGMNEAGIAVGNTNIQTRDVRLGVQYLTVLHRAIRAASTDEAIEAIVSAPRAGAHYYYVGGPDGRFVGLECSARQAARFEPGARDFVHCNHALDAAIAALHPDPNQPSTLFRQNRLTELLAQHAGPVGVADLKRMLSDRTGGANCLCRYETGDVSTNACVIMNPQTRTLHACRGQPDRGVWRTEQVD